MRFDDINQRCAEAGHPFRLEASQIQGRIDVTDYEGGKLFTIRDEGPTDYERMAELAAAYWQGVRNGSAGAKVRIQRAFLDSLDLMIAGDGEVRVRGSEG